MQQIKRNNKCRNFIDYFFALLLIAQVLLRVTLDTLKHQTKALYKILQCIQLCTYLFKELFRVLGSHFKTYESLPLTISLIMA